MKRAALVVLSTILFTSATKTHDFSASDIEGKTRSLDELLGERLTIISFWGTNCSPCKAELELLDSLYEVYRDSGLSVIAVNTDSKRSLANVAPMVNSQGWDFCVLTDPDGSLTSQFKVSAIPHSIYIKPDREILRIVTGFSKKDEKDIIETILDALHADIPVFSMGNCEPVKRSSSVKLTLREEAEIEVVLADSSGEILKTIYEGTLEAGFHTIHIEAQELEPGTYRVIATAGIFTQTCELTVQE
ncbi:redoxin domain-containing protein [candidate division WOR-3 bacterium]|nr:redoxin domain-containing protein [candidate division WOR-3 bacterium]